MGTQLVLKAVVAAAVTAGSMTGASAVGSAAVAPTHDIVGEELGAKTHQAPRRDRNDKQQAEAKRAKKANQAKRNKRNKKNKKNKSRRAVVGNKTFIRGWNSQPAEVLPGAPIADRVRVITAGQRRKRKIQVQRRLPGTTEWVPVVAMRTDDRGRARLVFAALPEGKASYRAYVPATRRFKQAKSSKRSVSVVPPDPIGVPLQDALIPPGAPDGTTGKTIAVASDVGVCGGRQHLTAQLIDWIDGPLIVPGDLAVPKGSAEDFANCYDPFYGRFKDRTYPVPGNHEYRTTDATDYFDYFGDGIGTVEDPWYSVDIGSWRFYMLNSNCEKEKVGCDPEGRQYQWLAEQLAQPQPKCTAAVWHHARWSSSRNGPDPVTADLYQLLYDGGVDVLMAGHKHHYERIAPLSPAGVVDVAGIRNFVVGTGGQNLVPFGDTVQPGSELRSSESHGVLRMELGPDGYRWAFMPVEAYSRTDPNWALCN